MISIDLKDPRKSKSFEKLSPKIQDRLLRVYKLLKKSDSQSDWHEFYIPIKPLAVNGGISRVVGYRGKGKRKFPIITHVIPHKAKFEKDCHKLLIKDIVKRYGIKPVLKEKPLFNWNAVELKVVFVLKKNKNLTTLQEVLIDMDAGVPLGTPDTGNLEKSLSDSIKDLLYGDDSIVYVQKPAKIYGDEAGIYISIRERKRALPSKVTGTNLEEAFRVDKEYVDSKLII